MPTGPRRATSSNKVNTTGKSRAVWGKWNGGGSYAPGEAEEFKSMSHAKSVFQSRIEGYDPATGSRFPAVADGSVMDLYKGHPDEGVHIKRMSQTRRGIRTENL